MHEATGTFDVGNPDLKIEKAQTVEIGLRKPKGRLRFEATAFYTRFQDFIYRNLTGATSDEDFAACDPTGTVGEFNLALYSQRDATFRGGEFQAQFDVAPVASVLFGVDMQYDYVRATFSDGSNVPRIPPQRLGGGVYFRDAHWFARVSLLHAFAQTNVADVAETTTDGYNLLKAELSYTKKLGPATADITSKVAFRDDSDATRIDKDVLTARSEGEAEIYAVAKSGGLVSSDTLRLSVSHVVALTIDPDDEGVRLGRETELRALATLASGATRVAVTDFVEWSTSDPRVVKVGNTARTKGVAKGVVTCSEG